MKEYLALMLLFAAVCAAQESEDHKNELAFGLGGIPALTQSDTPSLAPGSGIAYQVNYGRRLLESNTVALFGEINFVASPLRDVSSVVGTATHDFASLYVTPGIRLKFRPSSRISPYAAVGGGYADYEQSVKQIDGQPNQAPRELARGVFDFGADVDVQVCDSWRCVPKLVTSILPPIITVLRSRVGSTTSLLRVLRS